MTHPAPEELHAWLDGEPLSIEATAHVESCVDCRSLVGGVKDLHRALELWSEDASPAPDDAFADRIVEIASRPSRLSAPGVLPVRHRLRWIWGAAPIALAAAASMLFSFGIGRSPDSGSSAQVTNAKPGGHVPHGTYVISVDPGGEHGTYSVIEVQGTHPGTTTSVVWIEDEPFEDSSAVQ